MSIRITTELAEMDLDLIHGQLKASYWAKGMPRETLARALNHSLCFAVLDEGGAQLGFARAISDFATFAYLADVFIVEQARGLGVGKQLIAQVVAHPSLQGLRRFVLATRDAHEFYKPFGFEPLAAPQTFMEIWRPEIYFSGN